MKKMLTTGYLINMHIHEGACNTMGLSI